MIKIINHFFLFSFLFLLSCSCDSIRSLCYKSYECECESIRQREQYIDGYPVEQVFKYVPKKAGAKIEERIRCEYQNINNQSDVFTTKQYTIISCYNCHPTGVISNYLLIYHNNNMKKFKKVNLTFLGFKNKIDSAFSDNDGNIWIRISDSYPYEGKNGIQYKIESELIKLKILRNKAAKNEYNEYWFRCKCFGNCCKCEVIRRRVDLIENLPVKLKTKK